MLCFVLLSCACHDLVSPLADVADDGRGLNGTSKDACASLLFMSEIPIRDTCASLEMHMLEMHVHLERCYFPVQGTSMLETIAMIPSIASL